MTTDDTESTRMQSRFRGCLLGMACGDALGAGIEFMTPTEITTRFGIVTDFAGGGPFGWPAGAYTDDTQMALALADSLIAHPALDLVDLTRRWLAWLDADPPDVGNLTRDGLLLARAYLEEGRDPREAGEQVWLATDMEAAGNGGLMRVAPAALRFVHDRDRLMQAAADTSAITHYDPRCRASCVVFCLALQALLQSETPDALCLMDLADAVRALSPETADAVLGVFDLDAGDVPSSGYTLHTLQAALWPVERGLPLEEGIVSIVNLGYDADTCGAVAGALLGARDGEEAIPDRWQGQLQGCDRIRTTADRLHAVAQGVAG